MRRSRAKILCLAAAASLSLAVSGATASATQHKTLVLREGAAGPIAKAGAPTDNFETLHLGGYSCYQTTEGKLLANEQAVDRVAFTAEKERACGGEALAIVILSGGVKRIQMKTTGSVVETTNWQLELPGRCVYSISKLSATIPIGQELSSKALSGVAKLAPPKSAAGCASTEAASTVIDLSDVELGSVPYATEVRA